MRRIAVVGAGPAGFAAGRELRRLGFDGELTVVGAEPHGPYRRPPLSKEYLLAEGDIELHGREELRARWLLGRAATGLDLDGRRVLRGPARPVDFDGLVIATGVRPRTLSGAPALPGLFTLRDIGDARALREALATRPAVVVVGAGFIGSELASTLRSTGLPVVLIAAEGVPLRRPLGENAGAVVAELHRAHGVDLRTGAHVTAVTGEGRVERVRLDDGSVIPADAVVVAVGAVPQTDWLSGSGLRIEDGVLLGPDGLAAPGVAAAGDVACRPHPLLGGAPRRIEHYGNAIDQGARAARALMGAEAGPEPVPSFWSDLYGLRLQSFGFTGAEFEERLVEREPEGRFVAEYRHEGRLVGVVAAGFTRALIRYRTRITEALGSVRGPSSAAV